MVFIWECKSVIYSGTLASLERLCSFPWTETSGCEITNQPARVFLVKELTPFSPRYQTSCSFKMFLVLFILKAQDSHP